MRRLAVLLLFAATASVSSAASVSVLTYHNDKARTGRNTNETVLTLANVNTNSFSLHFTYAVDGYVYAQPLVLTGVAIPGNGVHNVVYVATEHDSVYAFDADSNAGPNAAPLWHVSFIDPSAGITSVPNGDVQCNDLVPEIGITSTPVIDPVGGTIYVVAKTAEVVGGVTNYIYRLHALDVATGAEKLGGPVVIQGSVPGTGYDTDGSGHVSFGSFLQLNRMALLLNNGVVYFGFGSHCDNDPYHGWLFGFNAETLATNGVFNSTPNGERGGIWENGCGPACDTSGNLYVSTGNGTFDPVNGNYGDTLLKFSSDSLVVTDYFTPFNHLSLESNDMDIASGGVVLLPDEAGSVAHPHLAVCAAKEGKIYLVDRDNMGKFNSGSDTQIVQSLPGALGSSGPEDGCFDTPAYFKNTLYYIGVDDVIKAFTITDGSIVSTPASQGSTVFGFPGATPSISANGTNDGIVWAIQSDAYQSNGPSILHAYNAADVSQELYNSSQAGTRDTLGGAVKFTVPTIANGKVYVGTESTLSVFGGPPDVALVASSLNPGGPFWVRADVANVPVIDHVDFLVDGVFNHRENEAPYFLFGDDGVNPLTGTLPTGAHEIIANVYSDETTLVVTSPAITVTIPPSPDVTLVASSLNPSDPFWVRADVTNVTTIAHVDFLVDGVFNHREDEAPYFLFGDDGVNPLTGTLPTGAHEIVANVYSDETTLVVTSPAITVTIIPSLLVTPASHDFGAIATGTTAQTSFTVTNLGGSTITGTATVSGVAFAIASGSPFSVPAFSSTNVDVSFTPPSEGAFSNDVIFASDGGVSTNPVTGTGAIVPAADFSGTPTAGLHPLTVTFSDISTGTITNRFWNFGDTITTNTANTNVVHQFVNTGTFTVSLTVFGPLNTNTLTRPNYIVVTNIPPFLVTSPSSHDFGLLTVGQTSTQTFSVINNGVDALSGTATVSGTSFALVNGSPFNVSGGATGSVNVSFSPGAAGSFTGSVVFTTDGGVSTNALTGSGAIAPSAGFGASPTNGAAPLLVTFTNASTGTITNQLWNFGDSGTSTLANPTHTYTTAGVFSVSLSVFGPLGSNTLTRPNFITVTNVIPVAAFTANPTNGAKPLLVTFTDASTGTVTNHLWSFGDSGTSTATSPTHTYTTAGVFSVSLTVFGPGGTSALTRTNLITVTNVVNIAPSVSIVRPADGMVYPPTNAITIVATASDSDGISKIEFFANGAKLGEGSSSPATNVFSAPLQNNNTLLAVATDNLGLSSTSTPVHIIVGAKNSPLGDWEVTISGTDKGIGFLTFSDDATATGYSIRLKVFGLNDVSGTWSNDAKGQVTGPFIEQLSGSTNWTGTLLGKATSLKKFSGNVTTNGATKTAYKWKGVPATTFPDLSGTWDGTATAPAVPPNTPVEVILTANPDKAGVFDIAAGNAPGVVIGQLIVTSKNNIDCYITLFLKQTTLSGKFKGSNSSLSLKGKDEDGASVKINLTRQ